MVRQSKAYIESQPGAIGHCKSCLHFREHPHEGTCGSCEGPLFPDEKPSHWEPQMQEDQQSYEIHTPSPALPIIYSHKRYSALLDSILSEMRHLAKVKGGEYAHGLDRLDNFRRAARENDLPPEVIWKVYAGKHWDSLTSYIRALKDGKTPELSEPIRGRALDLMVYLTLFVAMTEERGQG